MIDKLDYSKCVLCKACSNACPKNCITFENEHDTFLYPKIDYGKCINCNLCEKLCPIINKYETDESIKYVKIAKSRNESIRLKSSSGGIFSELGKSVIKQSGIVYGVKMTKDFDIIYDFADNEKELKKFQGSKYVQSDVGNTYRNIKENLELGKKILFSGCPCQVSGLKSYLKKDYKNLICVDFICHGVPSEKIFKSYIISLEKKYRSKVNKFSFRNKSNGWSNSSIRVKFENKKEYIEQWIYNPYMIGFLNNFFLKKSCYNCKFKSLKSGSDITIGDFWGAEVFMPDIDDDKGLSVVICNSIKGKKLFDDLKDTLDIYDIEFDKAVKYNQHLFRSAYENEKREEFFKDIYKIGIEDCIRKYCSIPWADAQKKKIRQKMGRIKRRIIKLCKI